MTLAVMGAATIPDAVSITLNRLVVEEGRKRFAYNDATGAQVTCKPNGNLSIGEGINLEVGLDDEEIDWLTARRLGKVAAQLVSYAWYAGADEVRKSVFLDIAFNGGVAGLLHYPKMLGFAAHGDWINAAAECTEKDPKLDASRYAPLRALLRAGAGHV